MLNCDFYIAVLETIYLWAKKKKRTQAGVTYAQKWRRRGRHPGREAEKVRSGDLNIESQLWLRRYGIKYNSSVSANLLWTLRRYIKKIWCQILQPRV